MTKIFLLVVLSVGWVPFARAADFTVNSTKDAVDAYAGDGLCTTLDGECTLRAAIQETNALVGPDRIFLPTGVFALTLVGADEDEGASGDLDIWDELEIMGAGASNTVIDGNRRDRVFHVRDGASISGITIQNGRSDVGGGIFVSIGSGGDVNLTDSVVWHNFAHELGGGIYREGRQPVIIRRSIISHNHTDGIGGGLAGGGLNFTSVTDSAITNNVASYGGGIGSNNFYAVIEVVRSTISRNRALRDGGGVYAFRVRLDSSALSHNRAGNCGGGLVTERTTGNTTVWNSTISGNRANGNGGGLCLRGVTYIYGSTIAGNSADSDRDGVGEGGGLFHEPLPDPSLSVLLAGTIVDRNVDSGQAPDCSAAASIVSEGYNLIGDSRGCFLTGNGTGNLLDVASRIMPLTNNGGPTLTHQLRRGSPAIDAGPVDCLGLLLDQRGVERPQGSSCDIGAFELAQDRRAITSTR